MKTEEEIKQKIVVMNDWAHKWYRQYEMSLQPPAGCEDDDALENYEKCAHWMRALEWVLK